MLQLSIESAAKIGGIRFVLVALSIALCVDRLGLISGFGISSVIVDGFDINGKFYLLICGGVLLAGSIKAIAIPFMRYTLQFFSAALPIIFYSIYHIETDKDILRNHIQKNDAIRAASAQDNAVKYSIIEKREREISDRRNLEELCLTVAICAVLNATSSNSIIRGAYFYLGAESELWWSFAWLLPLTIVIGTSVLLGINAIRVWDMDDYIEKIGFEDTPPLNAQDSSRLIQKYTRSGGATHVSVATIASPDSH